MISVRKRVITRLAATALATALFAGGAIATAGPAVADESATGNGGTTATLGGLTTAAKVKVNGKVVSGGLFTMNVDGGGTLKTYCVDFGTPTVRSAKYKETGWDSMSLGSNENSGKILWILENSYPQVDNLTELANTAGTRNLKPETAAAATQAAIWRYSDPEFALDATPVDPKAAKLTEWLYANAQDLAEPKPTLELSPAQVSGKPGQQLGPVTVETSADSVVITPGAGAADQGVSIINGSGEFVTEATPVANGTELFFDVPADAQDGMASFTASINNQVPVGRAFTGIESRTQAMILAGSTDASVNKTAQANWALDGPAPAYSYFESCVDGRVEVRVENEGDQDFTFQFEGQEYIVKPEADVVLHLPVENKQSYEVVILDEAGETIESHKGFLDCEVSPPVDEGEDEEENGEPDPASAGGTEGGDTEEPPAEKDESPNLAETGSNSNVGLIAGIAIALLVAGGGAVFFLRKRSS